MIFIMTTTSKSASKRNDLTNHLRDRIIIARDPAVFIFKSSPPILSILQLSARYLFFLAILLMEYLHSIKQRINTHRLVNFPTHSDLILPRHTLFYRPMGFPSRPLCTLLTTISFSRFWREVWPIEAPWSKLSGDSFIFFPFYFYLEIGLL